MKHSIRLLLAAAVVAGLSGCSPHPGAGTWTTVGEGEGGFFKLVVHFEGRAEFFAPDQEKELLRCFWAGESAESIRLDCTSAQQEDAKLHYSLAVTGADQAQLQQSGKVIAQFRRNGE